MVVLEKTLESRLVCKGIQPVHPKGDQSWGFIGRTDVEAETPIFGHLMWRADSLEKTLMLVGIEAGGQGADRGWDGWMASLTQWTWVCLASGSWWWTGKPSVLQSMRWQRVRHHWATELTDCPIQKSPFQGKLPQNMFDNLKRISLIIYWHAFHLQFHLETSEKSLPGTHVRWATVWRLSLVTHMWLSHSV